MALGSYAQIFLSTYFGSATCSGFSLVGHIGGAAQPIVFQKKIQLYIGEEERLGQPRAFLLNKKHDF